MKTRFVLLTIAAFLVTSQPAQASSDRTFQSVPEAASRSLELINRERAGAGLPSLALDDEVNGIADGWSRKLASDGRLSHNGDYLSEESMRRLDATILGENVAYSDTVDSTHDLFMQSPPHRRNILHPDYRLVGIAAVRADDGQIYLTQDFLTRRSKSASESPANTPPAQARHRRPERARPRPTAPRPRPAAAPARPAETESETTAAPHSPEADPPAPGPAPPSSGPEAPSPAAAAPPAAAAEPAAPPAVEAQMSGDVPGGVDPSAGDSSPESRPTLLRYAPLLGLALRPRWARLRG